MKKHYDIAIIGSGPGGYRAAILAALRNQKVAIIENSQWGGCCLNRGCVPKKAWHNTAKLLSKNSHFHKIGLSGKLKPNFNNAWEHQQATVNTIRSNYLDYMKRLGVDTINGHAHFNDHQSLQIQSDKEPVKNLTASNFIIATGSKPYIPDLFQQARHRILTTDTLFDSLPPDGNDVAIIGSGFIAVEFAYILKMLGKNISWYSRKPALSNSTFSPQAKKILSDKMKSYSLENTLDLPIQIHESNKKITLSFKNGENKIVDWVLLATGRKPNTFNLNLESTNIKCDEDGFIKTNSNLQTDSKNIYAIGDVRSSIMTANQAIADANIALKNIIGNTQNSVDEAWIPQALYGALEIAKIGHNEDEAEALGFEPAVGFSAFETSPAAMGQHETDGYTRVIADMDSGEFLGGEIVGENASELIHLFAIKTANENTPSLNVFSKLTVNHPSRAEEIVNATETLARKWGLDDFIFPLK